MKEPKNIATVTRKGLCHGCGLCVSVCPQNCISISVKNPYPIVDDNKCIRCKKCFSVCSGIEFDYLKMQKEFNRLRRPEYFLSKSTNKGIFNNSSSGGTVTSLLCFMFDNKIIDGAIVVENNKKEPWVPQVFIAKTKKEVINASQSKYSLIPTLSILKEVKNLKGKYALVCLPCQSHSLMKLDDSIIKEKIVLKIGLFCGLNVTYDSIEYTLKKIGIEDFSSIKKVEHRAGTWPGGFKVTMKDNKEYFIEKFKHNFVFPIFYPNRCRLCPDIRNEFADISVGDAWEKSLIERSDKNSLVIVRTAKGQEIMNKAIKNSFLKTKKISQEKALSFHRHMDKFKVLGAFDRINVYRFFGKPVPNFNKKTKSGLGAFTKSMFYCLLFWKLSWRFTRWLLFFIPYNLLGGLAKWYRKMMIGKD